MERKDKDKILTNYEQLVDRTDLDRLIHALLTKNVFSEKMIEPYMDLTKDARSRKRQLFLDILRRGPDAFNNLIEALFENGHWDLVQLVAPEYPLLGQSSYTISIKEERNSLKNSINGEPLKSFTENTLYFGDKEKPIKVKPATTFGQSSNPDLTCYSMRSKKRGILFMINNIEFDNSNLHKYREGALKDQQNLNDLFTQIGFHKIIILNNLKAKDMEDKLKELASNSELLSRTNCIFIVVASHGREDRTGTYINGVDGGYISINSILEKFNSTNCHMLHQVPKIFVFQICRGNLSDHGSKSHIESDFKSRIQMDGISEKNKMRTYCDMLIAHSTVPGFSSHRDTILGSWYVLSLCEIFMKNAHNTHLEDLFKLVDNRLKNINLEDDLEIDTLQTSSFENWGFNRHCYLNPGLFEE